MESIPTDFKDKPKSYGTTLEGSSNEIVDILKRGWDTFHKYFVYILLSALLGIGIGVKASKLFYEDKMNDAVLSGGFVYKGKPYTLIPK